MSNIESLIQEINTIHTVQISGVVVRLQGLIITIQTNQKNVGIGTRCKIETQQNGLLLAEVVGFDGDHALVMPYGDVTGIAAGACVFLETALTSIYPHESWCGRVLNALGDPIDSSSLPIKGPRPYQIYGTPIPASQRGRVQSRVNVGVRAINTFLTTCQGQRLGIFAGSGVGKSVLLSMLAKNTACDVCVIGMIGERGREVREFIEDTLGPEGLKKSVIVVATSDEPPLMRRQSAYTTLAIAEYFRDQGAHVLCLLDSVTRFAMAQREIGLSAGEPPTTKGYTPSVFAQLPRLLERAGPGIGDNSGSITAYFTVLVDGDDTNEPIADAVRGILDGHIVLDRSLAERAHFPAINIARSLSRTVPACHSSDENAVIRQARIVLSTYDDMADLIRLGAYRPGNNPDVDRAIQLYPGLMRFLSQSRDDVSFIDDDFELLRSILES